MQITAPSIEMRTFGGEGGKNKMDDLFFARFSNKVTGWSRKKILNSPVLTQ